MLVLKEALYSFVNSVWGYRMACWTYLEKRDLLTLFVSCSTYEVLVTILNYWNVDPGIQMGNTLLFSLISWEEYQPDTPWYLDFNPGSTRICQYDPGKDQEGGMEHLLYTSYSASCVLFLEKHYEVKIISISVLELRKQMEMQGVELAYHGSWPSN